MASGSGRRGRIRHPPHLRGRAIGMFYARRQRDPECIDMKLRREDRQRLVVHMPVRKEEEIRRMMKSLHSKQFESSRSKYGISQKYEYDFGAEYWRHLSSSASGYHFHSSEKSLKQVPDLDDELYNDLGRRQKETKFSSMLAFRKRLPSYESREAILKVIEYNQVVVVSGATGCGKTTQVPQYILDSFIESKRGSLCKIVCTQPRRISAISVAERVAQERGVPCGQKSDVGYHIRLECRLPRDQGSIVYCTIGIMLQQLQSSPYLDSISHIIVDEVHERDLLSDFLLIHLKDILKERKDLKLILMSATLNAEEFSDYFDDCPMIEIPGFTYPVEVFMLEDMIELTRYRPTSQRRQKRGKEQKAEEQRQYREREQYLMSVREQYSQATIEALLDWDEEKIDSDLIVAMLKYINRTQKEGAVLVFVPGWQQISNINKLLTEDPFFNSSRFLVIPLHSLMPTIQQREVFDRPPPGVQKIILATNIAETSITIDDIVYVIDSGKIKMKSLDPQTNIQLLQPEWVAISNMKQRSGRAGRTQPGKCYHMFTRHRAADLQLYQLPEMLRSTLEQLILKIKILKLGKAAPFLEKALNPPDPETVKKSIDMLKQLNALTPEEDLTPLGYHLAQLPMDPFTGKMILLGAIFSCLDPILSVAASLSFKDAFVIPLGKEELVDERKIELSEGSKSDHLMFANVIKLWEDAERYRNGHRFCYENFLSPSTLKMLANLKKQFAEYLKQQRFLEVIDPKFPDYNRNSDNSLLVRAIICAGLYPNVAKITKKAKLSKKFKRFLKATTSDGLRVTVHPKSVNACEMEIASDLLVYHLKVKSTDIYLHDTTAVTPYSLLFFGGDLKPGELRRYFQRGEQVHETISIDKWIVLECSKARAQLVLDLRKELDGLLEHKIMNPGMTNWQPDSKEAIVLNCIIELLTSEETMRVADLEEYPEDDDFY